LQDAELVALGVGQYHPGLLTGLPNVHSAAPEPKNPLDLSFLVVWPQVDVQPILCALLVAPEAEEQPWMRVFVFGYHHFIRRFINDLVAEHVSPESTK
jgi:hypothetical protein